MADTNQFKELNDGFTTAFLDRQFYSNSAYRPEFISNDPGRGRKVLSTIDRELEHCDRFAISVAFITMGGVTPLLQTLKELEEKRIPGKILTTDYLTFSEPEALERLASLKNIELRMFCTDRKTDGFHTKGYIFEKDEIYRILIGSSNMTLSAVTRNKEWNTKITGTKDGEVISGILAEFHQLWESSHSVAYDTFIEDYRIRYEAVKRQKKSPFRKQP